MLRKPLKPLGDQKRHLLVTPRINALLDGRVLPGLFPDVEAERLVGRFSAGYLVTVSRRITKKKPDVEQIVGANEVWAMCLRKPRPGWRLLGRWHDKNVFVALRPWEKHDLAGKYPQACQEVIADWEGLLPGEQPHTGTEVSDYLSGVYRDDDEP